MPPKKIKDIVKVQAPGGTATAGPPLGTSLGPKGINIGEFVKQFNEKTKDMNGMVIPAVITIYEDRSFTFITKTPPTPNLILKAAGIEKGSGEPNKTKVGSITMAQVEEIANIKMPDLNCEDIESAKRIVIGSARSMGVEIK
jgi:large subunit ribosomal protein L11